jgi:hypothetical protein
MKQDNSIASLARSQGKLYQQSGGTMLLNIIIIIVIFASIISAVVYMSSSSLRQAVSSNQGANAWSMAEAGYRYLSINYLKTKDGDYILPQNQTADDDKAAYLTLVSGRTYVIPNNGQFTLTVQPYWFYNTAATATGRNISVLLPVPPPTGSTFNMPATGEVKVGNTPGANIKTYDTGTFNSGTGIFTCRLASNTTLNKGDSVYQVLHPTTLPATQTLTPGGNLTLNLVIFPAGAFPAKDGLIEINPNPDTHLFRYNTAKAVGTVLTLYGLQRSDKSTFSISVTAATTVTFKKYLMAQSVGQVGTERRTLSFSQAILDSLPPMADVHKLDTKAEIDANFSHSSSVTSYEVASLTTSGGGSAVFSIMDSLATTGTGASAYNCGVFWYSNTGLINSLWAPPPVGTGVYLLTYEVQVKAATGNALKAGAIGLAFRSINVDTASESYLALTFMRYDLPNLYFTSFLNFTNGGTTAISSGNTVVGASSGATGVVNGTPVLTSGSWAGGNAAGMITFTTVTGAFSTGESLTVGGSYRAKVGTLTTINFGDTVVGATSGATGIVQGTPEITSGSWAGGNATGKIRFFSVTGTFSNNELLKVNGVNVAQMNGANYFACSLPPCTAGSTDFIPQTIKPKPSDFSPANYNIGPLLLVLWEKKSNGTLRWLAFKDITYDDYAKGYQDFSVPNGSCTNPPSNCSGSDGLIINDDASMYIRVQEKRVVLGSGAAVKLNDINVFYGDDSSRYIAPTWPVRNGDTIPYNINALRRLYHAGASPFTPVWVPEYISQWDQTVDFFSHIESGTPIGSQPQFQWDAVNPNVTDIAVFKICDDGSAACTSAPNGTLRLTELVTPDSGSYSQSEMGMLACGKVTTSPYSTAGFAEFAFKTPGTTSGGFVDTTLYW